MTDNVNTEDTKEFTAPVLPGDTATVQGELGSDAAKEETPHTGLRKSANFRGRKRNIPSNLPKAPVAAPVAPAPAKPAQASNARTVDFPSHIQEGLEEMEEGDIKRETAEYLHMYHQMTGSGALSNRARVVVALLLHPAHAELYAQVAGMLRPLSFKAIEEAVRNKQRKNFRTCLMNWLPGSEGKTSQSTARWLLECLSLNLVAEVLHNDELGDEYLNSISAANDGFSMKKALEEAVQIVDPCYERASCASNDRVPIDPAHIKLANLMYYVAKASGPSLVVCYRNVYEYLEQLVDWEEVGYALEPKAFHRAVTYLNSNDKAETMSKERVVLFEVVYDMYCLSPAMFVALLTTGEVNLQNVVEGYTAMCVKIETLKLRQQLKEAKHKSSAQSTQNATLEEAVTVATNALELIAKK